MEEKLKKLLIFVLFLPLLINAQDEDSVKVYLLNQIEIRSQKIALPDNVLPIDKDNLGTVINHKGFNLIRKGVFFAQDIYSDGFKRDDINVIVDGERYHSACPNRMDSPLTRVNPMDMESVELVKSTSGNQCGLAGKVEFIRATPVQQLRIKGSITALAAATSGIDAGFSIEKMGQRFSFRYAEGLPYSDADSKKFTDLYSYRDNYKYRLGEVSYYGNSSNWKYGASIAYNENISFPYLQMDERFNRVANGFVSYDENKLYFNYTSHLMDNTLRQSMMFMETDAKNLTIGLVGKTYDFFYRNWKADNQIRAMGMTITNNLIPEINNIGFSLLHEENAGSVNYSGRFGFSYFNINERESVNFYKQYVEEAKPSTAFFTFSFNTSYTTLIQNVVGFGLMAEINSEAPQTEALFISVKKPMLNPDWSGNPNLSQPLKAGLRSSILYDKFSLELFANYVWDYVSLTRLTTIKPVMTYKNIDAYFAGFNLGYESLYFDSELNYTYAQNTTEETPLAEIQPLNLKNTIKLPQVMGLNLYIRHTYNNAQTRIDENLGETTTPAYNKFDAGVTYSFSELTLNIEAENLTNAKYYQHLSYLRNPFASGMRVYEPGTTLRINLRYGM